MCGWLKAGNGILTCTQTHTHLNVHLKASELLFLVVFSLVYFRHIHISEFDVP